MRASSWPTPMWSSWCWGRPAPTPAGQCLEGVGAGLPQHHELHIGVDEGVILADADVEFVVLGETRTYSFEALTRAIRLIKGGAKFIATNPDVTGPSAEGPLPATGAVAAMITAATGISPYYIGKPNPLMMRTALNRIGAHSETSVMIGDRMDTDVKSGLEAGMRSILVLSGSTGAEDISTYPFRPTLVRDGIADVVPMVGELTPEIPVELGED